MLSFQSAVNVEKPSFLTLSSDRRFLFAVNEIETDKRTSGGRVTAFAIDPATGSLSYLNSQPTHGAGPCYVSLDRANRWALVANYTSGSATVLPVQADGSLGEATAVVRHTGRGVDPERQEAAHVHSILLDPSGPFALAAYLRIHQIIIYPFDQTSGQLDSGTPAVITAAPGAGPRHLAFHPNSRFLYAVNELNSTLSVYEFDAEQGTRRAVQTLSTLPDDFHGTNWAADLHLAPEGKTLYVSNRGHDSIVVFAVDASSGHVSPVEVVSTLGHFPRNFALDSTGSYLFAANQHSGTVVTFRVDATSGCITPTGQVLSIPSPMCIHVISSD